MDVADSICYDKKNMDYKHLHEDGYIPNCPNCYHMMNEIMSLRMELDRIQSREKRMKKNFTIAPTLYTFYRNGLSKRHLARYLCYSFFI